METSGLDTNSCQRSAISCQLKKENTGKRKLRSAGRRQQGRSRGLFFKINRGL